jgi:pimeloyl-ACP methyl ester carboxylesterase
VPVLNTSQGPVYHEVHGAGKPWLLLHADGASSLQFESVIDELSRHHQVTVLDYPGCGKSPRRAFSPAYYKENAKAALDVLKSVAPDKPAWAIGTGGGGIVGLWMAILAPRRIAGVVADSFDEFYRLEDIRDSDQEIACAPEWLMSHWRKMNGDDWEVVVRELHRVFANLAEQRRSVFDWRLEEVRCPVLMTASRKDPVIPQAGQRLLEVAEQLQHAQLILYPDGDHPALHSQADRFWPAVENYIERWEQPNQSLPASEP